MQLQPCGHPTTRIATRNDNGRKFCRDCKNIRNRESYPSSNRSRTITNTSLDRLVGSGAPPHDILDRALCGDLNDPRYTLDPKHLDDQDRHELQQVCDNCPVQAGCKQWADRDREFEGVAGGHTYQVVRVGNTRRRVATPLLAKADVA